MNRPCVNVVKRLMKEKQMFTLKKKCCCSSVITNDLIQSLFLKLKEFLSGNGFENDEEPKETVTDYLNKLAAEELDNRIIQLLRSFSKDIKIFG